MSGTVLFYLGRILAQAVVLMIVVAAVADVYLFFKEVIKAKHPVYFTAATLAAVLALKVVI